ncbi:MAG: BTAD domain-containing putative transcriptional regulator [Acidimicrobiales bacterium]
MSGSEGGELTEYGVLGPLVVSHDAEPLEIRGPRQRALLALLLLRANQVVSADVIVDLLWSGEPPRTATNTLQTHVVRLRQALSSSGRHQDGHSLLRTISSGYILDVEPDALDAERFERLLSEARRAAALERHAVAYELLRHALSLWRGPALVEFASDPFARVDAVRLDELRVDAQQELAVASLACGRLAEAIATLQLLVGANPLREQSVGHLMVALYRAGRQSDALQAFRQLRLALREELGLDPSPVLQRLEQSILEQAPNLELVSLGTTRRAHALPEAALVASPRFVGRVDELAWLGAQWHAASQGAPRLAVLEGEPGIGKTRMAAEFAERCYRGGTTVLWGRCTEEAGVPFDALAAALGPLVGTVAATTPLWHLFGVPEAPALRGGPEVERHRMFQLVSDLLERAAADAPVLLVLDDLQWVDRSTLALLGHFLRSAPAVCVLILATLRTTELPAADAVLSIVDELAADDRAGRREVRGLGAAEVDSLIASIVRPRAPENLAGLIQARTGGNPFFVTALLRELGEGGVPELDRLDGLGLPATVRGVVDRRVEQLQPVARQLLEVAAVIGVEFDSSVVGELTNLPQPSLAAVLDEIEAAGIAHHGEGNLYTFTHALIRDVIYDGVGPPRRALVHRDVGILLETHPDSGSRDRPAQLARHFASSGLAEVGGKAIAYATRAGEDALASFAYEDAASYFETALGLIDGGPVEVDELTRADVQFARARSAFASGDRTRAKADFEAVAAVYRHIADSDRLTQLALAISGTSMRHLWAEYGTVSDWLIELLREALAFTEGDATPDRVRLLARLAEELYFSPDAGMRTDIAEQALAMGRSLGEVHALADALNGRLRALWQPANSEERLPMAQELGDLAARIGNADLAMAGAGWAIVSRLERGLTEGIDEEVERFAAMTTEYRSPHHRVWALALLGGRALARGDFEKTERLLAEGMNVAPEVFGYAIQGFAGQLCTLRIEQGRAAEVLDAGRSFVAQYPQVPAWRAGLSVILAELGLHEEAREQIGVLTAGGLEAVRQDQEWLFLMGALAETCSVVGLPDIAAQCYEMLAPFADRCIVLGDGYVLWCSVEKSLGLLARVLGRADDACCHLERALAVHHALDSAPLVARARFELARALDAAGADPAAVTSQLESARRGATRLGQFGLLRWIELFAATSRAGD